MRWVFRKSSVNCRGAFTLIEVTVALIILGMIVGTVLIVANRAVDTVVLWQTKIEAFEVARENMEEILAKSSVTDMVEYGISERNPDINWETTIESFYEPMTNSMWMRAVCSAKFVNADGQERKIEFTHWLTSLNKKQVQQVLEQKRREMEYQLAMEAAESTGESLQDSGQEDEQLQQDEQEQSEQEQQSEESQQDAEAQAWKEIEVFIGPPPEGYEHWGQAPEEQFWQVVMEKLFRR